VNLNLLYSCPTPKARWHVPTTCCQASQNVVYKAQLRFSGTVYSLQTTVFLRKLCGLIYFLQTEVIHGLTRFYMRSKVYLHLNSFWMPYDLVRLSV
jgi:hypothetical protein